MSRVACPLIVVERWKLLLARGASDRVTSAARQPRLFSSLMDVSHRLARRVLPLHPVAMRTTFRRCFLVNFAMAPEVLAQRLPQHLQPDVHEGQSYVSIVIAQMHKMRPSFLPSACGITYNQVVYRAVVRCGQERGVTFLRSDADSRLMVAAGNALTFFRFHRAQVRWQIAPGRLGFQLSPVDGSGARIRADYDLGSAGVELPRTSAFADLPAAQRFLTELYAAFGGRRADGRVEVVRVARSRWQSLVVTDDAGEYEAMTSGLLFGSDQARFDSAFYVEQLAYDWRRLTLTPPLQLPAAATAQ